MAEPRPTLLSRFLQKHPRAQQPLGRAVASLIGTALVAAVVLWVLIIWHLMRRGRLIRERLSPPRVVRLPEVDSEAAENPNEPEPDDDPGDVPTSRANQ
jgi:hypothetical protein